jgi:hypothetical protein
MSVNTHVRDEKKDHAIHTKKNEDKWEDQRIRESRLVKGRFQCHEAKGGSIEFVFKKFKGDKVQKYKLRDGGEYELPISVVKHLNEDCNYPVYHETIDNNGDKLQEVGRRVQRYNFVQYPDL